MVCGLVWVVLLTIVTGSIGGIISYWDPNVRTLKTGRLGHMLVGIAGAISAVAIAILIFKLDLTVFETAFISDDGVVDGIIPSAIYVLALGFIGGFSGVRLLPLLSIVALRELEKRIDDLERSDEKERKKLYELSLSDKYIKGFVNLQNNEYKIALKWFEEYLQIDPNNADAWFYKAYALKRLDLIIEAEAAAEKATELQPDDMFNWYNLACYKHLNGVDFNEIMPIFRKCVTLVSDDEKDKLINYLETDVDLDSLRNNEDFIGLITALRCGG